MAGDGEAMADGGETGAEQPTFTAVIEAAALRDGEFANHQINGRNILIANIGGAFHCIEDKCSHADSPLSIGRLRNGVILCPLHGARFDIRTGEHLGPPAVRGVMTFPTRVVDGVVEACITHDAPASFFGD
jgi:3-phenylpropionate/trans-cinnamate dioxygenase ferredoxin subunit